MDEWSQEKVCKIPSFLLRSAGHGPVTGRCVATDRARLAARGVTVCEIQSWCPVEDDRIVKGLDWQTITLFLWKPSREKLWKINQNNDNCWTKDWNISDHFYDEWKVTLLLTLSLPGMEISIHFLSFLLWWLPSWRLMQAQPTLWSPAQKNTQSS